MATPGDGGREYKWPGSDATAEDLQIVADYDQNMDGVEQDTDAGYIAETEAEAQRAHYLGRLTTDQMYSSFDAL